jgi:hypothetical protein
MSALILSLSALFSLSSNLLFGLILAGFILMSLLILFLLSRSLLFGLILAVTLLMDSYLLSLSLSLSNALVAALK